MDRIEIRRDLRGQRRGSCLFYAVEGWARRIGIAEIIAHAQGSGAPLAAQVGFDFADLDGYRAHLVARNVHVAFRYPFEVLRLMGPGLDGRALLKTTGFDAMRVFNVDPILEQVASADRETLGC